MTDIDTKENEMPLDISNRAELGIDGNCGYALLGRNIQEGEAEFVEIPIAKPDCESSFMRPKGDEAAKLWACKEALSRLRIRLNMPNLSYYFDRSHPYGN